MEGEIIFLSIQIGLSSVFYNKPSKEDFNTDNRAMTKFLIASQKGKIHQCPNLILIQTTQRFFRLQETANSHHQLLESTAL